MKKIYTKLFDFFEIGDDYPPIVMGVLNISPESFYQGSVYEDLEKMKIAALEMIDNGAKMLDLGARSTAPWSKKITIEEEISRFKPAMEVLCNIIPNDIIISVDTQYMQVAQEALEISKKNGKKIIINDVSCLKTDPLLAHFVNENDLPIILMASKNIPGDLLTIEEIIYEFKKTIKDLKSKGYDIEKVILDPGIGHWIEEKTYKYDLKIIANLNTLRILNRPVLIAISRKSFIGTALNIPDPENRLSGTLSATAIAVYNGTHIIRTHDVTHQLNEIVELAYHVRKSK
ncbi:MAG: dihydropteroate synthase [Candidatus Heimdallarchaeota archaeon]